MLNMTFEEHILINASQERVFGFYADVPGWAKWDPSVKSATIQGAFASGAKGVLVPSSGPKANILFAEVVAPMSFTVVSRLPLCTMRFEHHLSSQEGMVKALHRVTFAGPLAPLFGRLIGGSIRRDLPVTLEGLKRVSEGLN
ncbi:MAG: polyketide cyclase [Bacteroidia bacterium]|nr:MAG: polyketide cyclase [Bacteroidia bacterium]